MGRRRIEIEEIKEPRSKQVTFAKRKRGLQKKCWELSKLCNAEVALIIFNSAGKLFTFSSSDLPQLIQRYSSTKEADLLESRTTQELASKFLNNGSSQERKFAVSKHGDSGLPSDDKSGVRLRRGAGQSSSSIAELTSIQQPPPTSVLPDSSIFGDLSLLASTPLMGDPCMSDPDLDADSMSLPSGCFEQQLEMELAGGQICEQESALQRKRTLPSQAEQQSSGQHSGNCTARSNMIAEDTFPSQQPSSGVSCASAPSIPKGSRYKRRRQILGWPAAYRKVRSPDRSMHKSWATWAHAASRLQAQ